MPGPIQNVSYLHLRNRVTVVGIALIGILLIPSAKIFHDDYGTLLMWVDMVGLATLILFLTIGIPLWERAPVTFSWGENGIEVVLSSSLSRKPTHISWNNVIDVWKANNELDQYHVLYLPGKGTPQCRTTRDGKTYYYSPDAKAITVTQQQLLEMRPYLPARSRVERYLDKT